MIIPQGHTHHRTATPRNPKSESSSYLPEIGAAVRSEIGTDKERKRERERAKESGTKAGLYCVSESSRKPHDHSGTLLVAGLQTPLMPRGRREIDRETEREEERERERSIYL